MSDKVIGEKLVMYDLLSEEEIQKSRSLIESVSLPTIPAVVQEANIELSKAVPDMTMLVEIVSKDPVLCGEIVQTVNSPYYGLMRKVGSVQQAIMMLGTERLKNVMVTAGLRKVIHEAGSEFLRFWDQADMVACCASGIAGLTQGVEPDEAYMAGLFMDTGMMAFIQKHDKYNELMIKQYSHPYTIIKLEEQLFGVDHAIISYFLTQDWSLPEDICQAILYHHSDSYEIFDSLKLRSLVGVLQLSFILVMDQLRENHGLEQTEEQLVFREMALEELMIELEDAEDISKEFALSW